MENQQKSADIGETAVLESELDFHLLAMLGSGEKSIIDYIKQRYAEAETSLERLKRLPGHLGETEKEAAYQNAAYFVSKLPDIGGMH